MIYGAGCRFRDPIAFRPDDELWKALQRHFTSRAITNDVPHPTPVNMSNLKSISFVAYSAYQSGGSGGEQVYRTPGNLRDKDKRDTSWIMVRRIVAQYFEHMLTFGAVLPRGG